MLNHIMQKPYPVLHSQEKQLKDEIRRLYPCEYGVLRKINHTDVL
jgi:hypothetical protein